MSAGVVFVELADADAVGQACSSQFATSGVVIKAGQPYETALAEVRRHFGVEDDECYTCSFAQRFPGRENRFIVAASAWEMVAPGTYLEFIIAKLQVKPSPSSPAAGSDGQPLGPAPAGQRLRSSPIRRNSKLYSPPANPPSGLPHSQNSGACITPATPSGTDTDGGTDGRVTDSEPEEDFADHIASLTARRRSPLTTPRERSASAAPAGPERDRSATPSPSNRSADYKIYLQRQLHAERESEERGLRDSTEEPTSPGAEAMDRDNQPLEPTMRPPGMGASSGETEVSLMIGLDANGNVNFVPRSPPPGRAAALRASTTPRGKEKGKGKERAAVMEATAAASDGADADADDSPGSVKAELLSSQHARACLQQTAVPTPPKPVIGTRAPFSTASRLACKPNVQARSTLSETSPRTHSIAPSTSSDNSRKRSTPSTPEEEVFTPSKIRCVTASRLQREGWIPPAPATSRQQRRFTSASPQKPSSAARKSWAEKRREALSRPRASIPQPGRSERFHYWLRLPNWPTAPKNKGPLHPKYIFKQSARGNITLGLRLEHVFRSASEASGWDMQDLRATFYTLDEEGKLTSTYVWGWDDVLLGFRDLEEMGMPEVGGLIDFDYIPYDPTRTYFDTE